MIHIKNGVRLHGVRAEIVLAIGIVDQQYEAIGEDAVITSVIDGAHMRASIHYTGGAFDVRLPESDPEEIRQRIANALGEDYDVVVEANHIHVEWQPKDMY